MKNWYRLNKAELSYLSAIEEPVFSNYLKKRLSTPVVVVTYGATIIHVWSLKWFKKKVSDGNLMRCYKYEIHAKY